MATRNQSRTLIGRWVRALMLVVIAVVVPSCGGGGGGGAPPVPPQNWLVMVYLASDNNLESSVPAILTQMQNATASGYVTVVVEEETTNVLVNGSTTAKRLKIQGGVAQTIQDLGEINTATPGAVSSFVQWAVTNYGSPSSRNILILSDHGGQWTGWAQDVTGYPQPENAPVIGYGGLKTMFNSIQTLTGIVKLDLIGFDACLMAGLEIDLLLSNYANYRVSSCEVEFGDWDYQGLLSALATNPAMTVQSFGQVICDTTIALRNSANIQNQTMSLANLANTPALVNAVDFFATILQITMPSQLFPMAQSRRLSPEYGNMSQVFAGTLVDLREFASRVAANASNAGLISAANATVAAVDAEIIYKRQGLLEGGHGGASVYFPTKGGLDPAYTSAVDLALVTQWTNFVSAYQSAMSANTIPPTVTINAPPSGTTVPVAVNFTVDGNDITADIFDVGAKIMTQTGPTTWFMWGDIDFGNLTAGTWGYTWNGQAFTIRDGTSADWLCAQSPMVSGNLYLSKMQITRGAQSLDVDVFFNLSWVTGSGSIQGVYYQVPTGGAAGVTQVITVKTGDTLKMYYPILDTTTNAVTYLLSGVSLTVPAAGLSGITVGQQILPTGSHGFMILAQDYAGNFNGALETYNVP